MKSLMCLPVRHLNIRELTETDFYRICEEERVEVHELDSPSSFYIRTGGVRAIVLTTREYGLERRFSAFHELGHHFLHGGEAVDTALLRRPRESRKEYEADAFAAIALCPLSAFVSGEWLSEATDPYSSRIWILRRKIWERYGI